MFWPFWGSAWVGLRGVNLKNKCQLRYVLIYLSREHPTCAKWSKREKWILYLTTDFIIIRVVIYESNQRHSNSYRTYWVVRLYVIICDLVKMGEWREMRSLFPMVKYIYSECVPESGLLGWLCHLKYMFPVVKYMAVYLCSQRCNREYNRVTERAFHASALLPLHSAACSVFSMDSNCLMRGCREDAILRGMQRKGYRDTFPQETFWLGDGKQYFVMRVVRQCKGLPTRKAEEPLSLGNCSSLSYDTQQPGAASKSVLSLKLALFWAGWPPCFEHQTTSRGPIQPKALYDFDWFSKEYPESWAGLNHL